MARKPIGGFVFLTVQQLCLLWWAYRSRLIQLRDFRVWFAAHEMVARRCQIDTDQVPAYTSKELHGLIGGVGGEHIRASIHRLEVLGLLTWSSTKLTFAISTLDLQSTHDLVDFYAMQDATPHPTRRVPVPRQVIRLIAGGLKASVIATMLGHLIRCLYYREQRCCSGGWCKASWIAEVFGMDLRSVKAARKHLVAMGWLRTFDTSQRLSNRWGTYALINLSWTRATLEKTAEDSATPPPSVSPPPSEFFTAKLPPLDKEDKEPFQEFQHQKPAPQADITPPSLTLHHTAPGSSGPASGVNEQQQAKPKKITLQAPTLGHIVPEDLQDTARLLTLFEQAQTHGLIGTSDSHRLTFLSLAEHAKVVGSANPCGLFAALVRRQCWHFVTDSDEDAAHQRFKVHLYGADQQTRGAPPPHDRTQPELSKDAAIVRYLQTQLARAGFGGDVFGLMSRDDAAWTRERWDHAVRELEQTQRAWHQANAFHRLGELASLGEVLQPL